MKEILKNSYNKSADSYNQKFHDHQFKKYDFLIPEIIINNNDNILDAGCGTALLYEYFQKNNFKIQYTGFDFAEKMLFEAEKSGANVLNHDITFTFPFQKEMFDHVFCFTVIGIIPYNDNFIISEISRVIKKEGFFILTILKQNFDEAIFDILEKNGFKVIKCFENCGQDRGIIAKKI
jgi:ubiquinone/menaquinone biosynthesis C-methylase UbiE